MTTQRLARRMFELVEPIGVLPYRVEEPNEELQALGCRNYWDGYFAGRAAPLGRDVPASVVDAIFYNFGPGEVARHIPRVWQILTPAQALAAVERGSVAALHRILGDQADSAGVRRAADLLTRAGTHASPEGRPLFAARHTLPVPAEPVARLWHSATLLREHRGDGHNATLLTEGIGRTESHVLLAVAEGMPAEKFGRVHHLPAEYLAAVIDGVRTRGLVDADGRITALGRETKQRVEDRTDELAARAYDCLSPAELDQLDADLSPIAATINASFD